MIARRNQSLEARSGRLRRESAQHSGLKEGCSAATPARAQLLRTDWEGEQAELLGFDAAHVALAQIRDEDSRGVINHSHRAHLTRTARELDLEHEVESSELREHSEPLCIRLQSDGVRTKLLTFAVRDAMVGSVQETQMGSLSVCGQRNKRRGSAAGGYFG